MLACFIWAGNALKFIIVKSESHNSGRKTCSIITLVVECLYREYACNPKRQGIDAKVIDHRNVDQ